MPATDNLALPYIAGAQAQKHVTHNEALRMLDAVVMLAVKDRDLAAPPSMPDPGDRYIVAAGASGAWTGRSGDVAAWQDGAWMFHAPRAGWLASVLDEGILAMFDGAGWEEVVGAGEGGGGGEVDFQNIELIGIGTEADETNPFAAKLNNALWTAREVAEGGDGDLRYVMNKEGSASVLSLLMQSGYEGRAEIGLVGDDDLLFKVSDDGETWREAIRIDHTTGEVSFPNTTLGGGAVTREALPANRTYYVRTDGDDGNDGLSNTSGGAFLTIQKALNVILGTLDLYGYNATIQVGNGTYSAGASMASAQVGAGVITLRGDPTTPSNVVISTTGSCISVSGAAARLAVAGVRLTSASGHCLIASGPASRITFADVEFGSSGQAHIASFNRSSIEASGNYAIVASSGWAHAHATQGGFINLETRTVTITGTPALLPFASAQLSSILMARNMTFSGSATGSRYISAHNSLIMTGGAGATYFPGSGSGTTDTGGLYV